MQSLIDSFIETLRDAGSRGTPLFIRGGGSKAFYGRTVPAAELPIGDYAGVIEYSPTELVVSADPNWDYEVTTGIWSLHVRADGTFRASHAGDQFTYR